MSSSASRCALALASLTCACAELTPIEPGASVIVVHAVLNPGDSVQQVVLQRTEDGRSFGIPVTGASVILTTPDGTSIVATEGMSAGDTVQHVQPMPVYNIASGSLTSGSPYRLHVVLPSGATVDGATTIPDGVPAVVTTQRRMNAETDTLRLSWPRVQGARAYEVRIFTLFTSYVAYVDTSIVLPGLAVRGDARVFQPGYAHDVTVSAIDANYYEYYRRNSDPFTGTALPTSLSGAVGVFGSLVPIMRVTVNVK
jgi:Domain of unknown function (DUF4249)